MTDHKPFKIFVVEDDDWYNRLLVHTLSLNPDYEITNFFNGKDLLNNLHEEPDVLTLDYRLPDMTGLDILKQVKEINPDIQVILISEQSDIDTVVDLLKYGAYDYIVKSKDIKERLLNTIQNIRQGVGMKKEITALRKEVQRKYSFQNSIIGESAAIKRVFELIKKAIETNITVTVTGETGTGKELVAKAIHYNSKRKENNFVPVNVAAIPAELIESELFGHEKGAFTGASYRRIGKFEEANGGTLFLDEIGEMDPAFQAKLLRAIQEKEVTRIGSNNPVKTDCRIIVATNKNLKSEVKSGNFRQDLYFRLLGLPIELPPLRNRDKDVLILSGFFISQFCEENELPQKTLTDIAKKKLLSYSWPGNIRELKSVVELSAALSNGNNIDAPDLLFGSDDPLPEVISEELTLREYNRRIIVAFLQKHDNNYQTVADKLDISVSTIYRMLKEEKFNNE
ncbi:MAG TPA: sigma-54 dependent transcriptional regulator [Bacteroidales bacterium]|nr:sigma-54 dependent transcriptional regulator [Bacteroidales bacterium]HRX97178.1 sigma-54 dependent transcriptional regulator [Bacteroidales bacterium]